MHNKSQTVLRNNIIFLFSKHGPRKTNYVHQLGRSVGVRIGEEGSLKESGFPLRSRSLF